MLTLGYDIGSSSIKCAILDCETGNTVARATRKLESKGCDWIVANDVSPEAGVFGGDKNTVHLVTRSQVQSWPEMTKEGVADRLMQAAGAWVADADLGASISQAKAAPPA